MQADGNLVVYFWLGHREIAAWDANTQGNSGARFVVQNDGNAVVYNAAGNDVWDTNTCCR